MLQIDGAKDTGAVPHWNVIPPPRGMSASGIALEGRGDRGRVDRVGRAGQRSHEPEDGGEAVGVAVAPGSMSV